LFGDAGEARDHVFVVYGRDRLALTTLNGILDRMGLGVIDWEGAIALTGNAAPHAREVLQRAMRSVKAVIVLMTGDEEGRLLPQFCTQEELDSEGVMRPQPRQNVIFEAGLALGLFPANTIMVKLGRLSLPSDLDGVQYVALDPTPESRRALVNRLRTAGCRVQPWREIGGSPELPNADADLPQLRAKVRGAHLALMRRLRSLIPVPGLGGSLEVATHAEIGENLVLSVKLEAGTEIVGVQHWLPGSATPQKLTLDHARRSDTLLEIPCQVSGPAGMHFFDLLGKPREAEGSEILARAGCAVAEA
jgi:hypothetical protein